MPGFHPQDCERQRIASELLKVSSPWSGGERAAPGGTCLPTGREEPSAHPGLAFPTVLRPEISLCINPTSLRGLRYHLLADDTEICLSNAKLAPPFPGVFSRYRTQHLEGCT